MTTYLVTYRATVRRTYVVEASCEDVADEVAYELLKDDFGSVDVLDVDIQVADKEEIEG